MNAPDRTDAELLDSVRTGDDDALSALLARHAPTVMRFAMKMCRNEADAEDVLQDTLLAAARGVRDLRGGAAVSTWLYTVARSYCIKKRRRSKHAPDALVPLDDESAHALPSPTGTPEEDAAEHEVGAALERAIAGLDDASREVIVLRDVEGLSANEAAEVLGTSVDAVKSRLHRARATLRLALAPLVTPMAPSVPSDPACPDVVDMLSRHLEGDVGPEACAAMEAHVSSCGSCSRACDSLRSVVSLCHASAGDSVSPDVRRRMEEIVRTAVSKR